MLCMGRMKQSGSRLLATLYYHSFRYSLNNAKEKNPHKFNIKQEMDGQYYNLWSTDNDRTMDKLFKIKDLRKRRPLSFFKCRWTQLGIPYTLLLFYKGKIIMLIYKYYFKKLLNYNSSILFY